MDITYLDSVAFWGKSRLHDAEALSKMIFAALIIAAAIINTSLIGQVAILFSLILLARFAGRLAIGFLLHLSFYPAIFALIFALSGLSILPAEVLLLRVINISMTLLILISTTPYPELFAYLKRFMPSLLVDLIYLTYRGFFILIKQIGNFTVAIKLRSGFQWNRPHRSLVNMGAGLGHVLVHALESGDHISESLKLRGYQQGNIGSLGHQPVITVNDIVLIILGIILLLVGVLV